MATRQMARKKENEFEQIPTFSQVQPEHGSLKLNAYKQGYDDALGVVSETLDLVSNVLQSRGKYPLTQERIARLNLPSAENVDTKFDNDTIKAELDFPRVGAEPIHLTAILSPGHDSITLSYPDGKLSHIDRTGRDMVVSEA